ncbi:MAG: 30S ribosomal protein S6 [Candidatus Paceibacterota bacterium]
MLYEITHILKPELTNEEQSDLNSKINSIIASLSGKVNPAERTFSVERGGTDENNLRKFAYPIKHYRQGYYYTITFELEPTKLKELESTLRREANILRFLIVKDFINLSEIAVETKSEESKESETKVAKDSKKD